MKCPRCQKEQSESVECIWCGVIIARYLARQEETHQTAPTAQPDNPKPPAGNEKLAYRITALLLPPVAARRDFYISLARVVQSGASPLDALTTIEMSGSGRTVLMARAAREGLHNGQPLADALGRKKTLFPEVHLALLQVGEQSGHLVETLNLLASLDEARLEQARGLRSRLAYPALVLLLSCLILPLPMLVLGSTAAYGTEVVKRLSLLALVAGSLWAGFRLTAGMGTPLLQALPGSLERWLMPGKSSFFFLVMRTCLRSGIPLTRSLELASRVWTTRDNRKATRQAAHALQSGSTLTDALLPLVGRKHLLTLSTGEMSGKLEESFSDLEKDFTRKSGARAKLVSLLVSTAIALAIMAYVASQIFAGFQQNMGSEMEEFDREIMHETRGIWNRQ